jgi:hypothetical protein
MIIIIITAGVKRCKSAAPSAKRRALVPIIPRRLAALTA